MWFLFRVLHIRIQVWVLFTNPINIQLINTTEELSPPTPPPQQTQMSIRLKELKGCLKPGWELSKRQTAG